MDLTDFHTLPAAELDAEFQRMFGNPSTPASVRRADPSPADLAEAGTLSEEFA